MLKKEKIKLNQLKEFVLSFFLIVYFMIPTSDIYNIHFDQ